MKTTAKKDVRLADLPEATGTVKGGGIKVPESPRSTGEQFEPNLFEPNRTKRSLAPCI